jgi:hypothetical protein
VAEIAIVVVLSRVGAKRTGAPAVERGRINAWTRAPPLFPREQVCGTFADAGCARVPTAARRWKTLLLRYERQRSDLDNTIK